MNISTLTRPLGGLTLAAGLALSFAACTDDDEASGINSVDKWCTVIDDVDDRFQTADTESESFDAQQAQYREINELLHSLNNSIEVVEDDRRDAVQADIAWAIDFTDAFIDAESEQAAGDELFAEDGIFAEYEDLDPAGAEWILQECGVDITGEG